YTVLFFAVATRLKTPSQLWRLLSAIVLAGTICALIGIAQHFGHAPLGIRSTSGSARVSGTAGNPIFFATILIVTLLITVGMSLSIRELTRKTLTWLTVSGLVIAIHFAALMVTLSRGPWIGAAVGLLAVSTLAPLMFGQSRSFRTGFLVISAFLVALAFLGFASTPDGVTGPGIERTSVNDIQGRATTLAGVFDPVSNPRLTRWDGAVDLALNRPEPPSGAQPGYLVRSLFGYGPDSFADVFTLVAPQRLSGTRTTAAHNVPLNQLVETGVIGLLAWMALWTSLVHLLLRDLWMHRQDGNARQVATLAIGASLMAWFVAGLTGIPQTGDTVLVWLLIGVAAAIPNVFATSDGNVPAPVTTTQTPSPALQTSAIVAIGLIALAAIWISWTENVQRVSADSTAASAVRSDTGNPDVDGRLSDIDGAISLSPDQPRYHTIRSEIYERVALELASQNPFAAMQESVDSAERALALNPLDRDLNFRAAYVNWELAKMGDPDSALRTYHLYQELALMSPQHQSVGPRLTAIGEALGLTP
ncbi:MAG: O-antigen ligase family protein, partial [Chloroflexi bacterium]|nr:O-antigen ligase family protein [Chloroflexota bacterium]